MIHIIDHRGIQPLLPIRPVLQGRHRRRPLLVRPNGFITTNGEPFGGIDAVLTTQQSASTISGK